MTEEKHYTDNFQAGKKSKSLCGEKFYSHKHFTLVLKDITCLKCRKLLNLQ